MSQPLFIRENLLPGDFFHVWSTGKYGKQIQHVIGSVGTHDALVLDHFHVGESTVKPPFAHRTALDVYEDRLRAGTCRVAILRIPDLTTEQRRRIADAWIEHVQGEFYDFLGIVRLGVKHLLLRALPDDSIAREEALGWQWAHWCTEGLRTATLKSSAGHIDPLGKENPTPKTVENRARDGRLVDVSLRCLSEAGLRYRLLIPGVV